ncbi:hypothetical protein KP626_07085 [Christensenella sp. MSJ-20]|uniref:hypothetical protein n=1 Tax=Christensenella sp. MSJ-20 TaxID=2841518 RepID=UPI001C747F3B|nr:hypothetical protein KP626_07085 [Christensenella sp. MSJ-20]
MASRKTSIVKKLIPQPIHHERFDWDIGDIIKDKAHEAKLLKRWQHDYASIIDFGIAPFISAKWIKRLKHYSINGLPTYELRYKIILEIRMIFVMQNKNPVYLTAFCKNNNFSYDDEIQRATDRYNELLQRGDI